MEWLDKVARGRINSFKKFPSADEFPNLIAAFAAQIISTLYKLLRKIVEQVRWNPLEIVYANEQNHSLSCGFSHRKINSK